MDECKELYFRLVKQAHTDGAPDEEYSVRTITMQQINSAYRRRDLTTLKLLESMMPPPSRASSPLPPESRSNTVNTSQHKTGARPNSPSAPSRTSNLPNDPKPTQTVSANDLSLEKLDELWPTIKATTKSINRRIEAILQQVNPAIIDGTMIVLVSQYEFHRNRVNSDEVGRVIEDVISRLVHRKIQISCVTPDEAAALVNAGAGERTRNNPDFQ